VFDRWIEISLAEQRLRLYDGESLLKSYVVSTAARGAGERMHSNRTPRGRHEIRHKIGEGEPRGAVFAGRRPTGEIFSRELANREPERDWILSRILWLRGMEPGRNRLGDVDTMRRYIYIHGTPEEDRLGTAASHGCIRMANDDVIELYDLVELRVRVEIVDAPVGPLRGVGST
jgi:lipoprotein-anchoring transpeptidase ErfK/SrfK